MASNFPNSPDTSPPSDLSIPIDTSYRAHLEMLNFAIDFHINGNFAEADLLYDDFLRRYPNHTEGLKFKGKLCIDTQREAEGEALLRTALTHEPDAIDTLFYLAEALTAQAKVSEAILCYDQLLKTDPSHSDARFQLAVLLLQEEHFDQAKSGFLAVLEQTPNHYDALNYLGIAYQQTQNLKSAETSFRDAILVDPRKVEAHINLGNLLAELHCFKSAMTCLNQALELEPNHPNALFNQAYLWQVEGEKKLALAGYQHLLKLHPDQNEAMNNLGQVLESLDRQEEAQAWYEKAHILDPSNTTTMFHLGNLYQHYQKPEQALTYYLQILDYEPDNVTANYLVSALAGLHQRQAPEKYVQDLFDGFALEFEECLLHELGYQTPDILLDLLTTRYPQRHFSRAIDLGCGTGLMGEKIAALCDHITGVDLSPKMLVQAAQKDIYDALEHAELVEWFSRDASEYELIVCADVLVYIGDLAAILNAASQHLMPGGVMVFSTEFMDNDGYELRANGRFKHGQTYVRSLLEKNGLELQTVQTLPIRLEKGQPVPGDCFVVSKPTVRKRASSGMDLR